MTYLLLQTFVLLLSAYFLGAFVACLARRAMGAREATFAGVAAGVSHEPYHPAEVMPLVKPKPFDPVQPKIDILPRPARKPIPETTTTALDISRFERALTGPDPNEGMPRVMIVEICPAVLEPVTGPPQPFMPEPAVADDGYVHPSVEEPAEVFARDDDSRSDDGALGEASAVVAEDDGGAESAPSSGVAMASAAAAAAMSVAHSSSYAAYREETQRREVFEEATSETDIVEDVEAVSVSEMSETDGDEPNVSPHDLTPGASGSDVADDSDGGYAAAEDVISDGDDLQSIRAIDPDTEQILKINGITTFAQIAHWTPEDIEEVDTVLELDGRVDQEQWVEQAQILARGGDTYYSRMRAAQKLAEHGDAPDDAPENELGDTRVQEVAESDGDGSRESAIAAAAASIAGAAGTFIHPDEVGADETEGGEAEADAYGAADAVLTDEARAGTSEPVLRDEDLAEDHSAEDAEHILEEVEEQSLAHGDDASDAAHAHAEADARDAVEDVSDGEVLDAADSEPVAEQVSEVAEPSVSPATQGRSVSEMAAAAAAAIAAASASVTRGIRPIEPLSPLSRADPNVVMPTRLTDAIRERDAQASAQASPQTTAATSVPSVGKPRGEGGGQQGGKGDDLKRIRGIGVLIERQLNANGVTRYQQIANWSSGDIAVISAKLDFKGRIERENWVEQARILSSGGDTEFSKRVDRGEVDTSS